jgi:hypothetical protein
LPFIGHDPVHYFPATGQEVQLNNRHFEAVTKSLSIFIDNDAFEG